MSKPKCSCGAEGKIEDRLPRGWKRFKEITYCDKCWRKNFVLRAISIPIVRPLGEGIGWKELDKVLSEVWAESTACANFLMSEYYARDVRRTRESGKSMPGMPKIYLYPEAVARFPNMSSNAVAGMCQSIGRKYSAERYKIVWTSSATNSNFRYPYPASFPNKAWTASYQTAGKESGDLIPCVSIPLRKGEDRFVLQLRGGRDFARQLRDFKQIIEGDACRGDITIYRQRVGGNENRSGVEGTDSGDKKAMFRVMCKMVGWFPRRQCAGASGVLHVKSQVDSMLAAFSEDDEKIWWLNADHVRRWKAEHKRQLQRWSEDQKHELRPDVPFQSRRETACNKFHNRIESFIKEAVSHVCGVATRRRISEIWYDDKDQRYLSEFAWAALATRMENKCNELGIKFKHVNKDEQEDNQRKKKAERDAKKKEENAVPI